MRTPDVRTWVVVCRDKDGNEQRTVTATSAEMPGIKQEIKRDGGEVVRTYECR